MKSMDQAKLFIINNHQNDIVVRCQFLFIILYFICISDCLLWILFIFHLSTEDRHVLGCFCYLELESKHYDIKNPN